MRLLIYLIYFFHSIIEKHTTTPVIMMGIIFTIIKNSISTSVIDLGCNVLGIIKLKIRLDEMYSNIGSMIIPNLIIFLVTSNKFRAHGHIHVLNVCNFLNLYRNNLQSNQEVFYLVKNTFYARYFSFNRLHNPLIY